MMTLPVKLLSVLISLAMMLTGTYGMEAPEPTARTLTVSNITLAVDDESVTLNPALALDVATDGATALYGAAVRLADRELFPVRLSVTGEALTALVKNANVAFTVPAEALDALTAGMTENISMDDESAALLKFMTEEYLPAYAKALQKLSDPANLQTYKDLSRRIMDEHVDRGEGEEGTVTLDGAEYPVTTYTYQMDAAQLMDMCDAVYTADEELHALYEAVFKLYGMLPEESGLNGISSFADLSEKTGLSMTADITESIGEGDLRVMDMELTLDIASMVPVQMEAEESYSEPAAGKASGFARVKPGEADVEEAEAEAIIPADIAPMVFFIHSEELNGETATTGSMDYSAENVAMRMDMNADQTPEATQIQMTMEMDAGDEGGLRYEIDAGRDGEDRNLNADFTFESDGQTVTGSCTYGRQGTEDGGATCALAAGMSAGQGEDGMAMQLNVRGAKAVDGTGSDHVETELFVDTHTVRLAFDAEVSGEAIEDAAASVEPVVLDNLTDMEALMANEAVQGAALQAGGSFMSDASALMQEECVVRLVEMFGRLFAEEAEETRADGGEDATDGGEGGELSFEAPALDYLPEGWALADTEVDAEYDVVTASYASEDGESSMYCTFFPSAGGASQRYTLDEGGALVPMEAPEVTVEEYDYGWNIQVDRDGVTANMSIISEDVDLDEVARIISGMHF